SGDSGAFLLEQALDEARRAAVPLRQHGSRQVGLGETPLDVLLDRLQARRAQVARRRRRAIPAGADRERDEIMHMAGEQMLQGSIGHQLLATTAADVIAQQTERGRLRRDRPQAEIVDPVPARAPSAARGHRSVSTSPGGSYVNRQGSVADTTVAPPS